MNIVDSRNDATDLNTLAQAVGLIVLQWGQAEQSLDLLVSMLWHYFNGKHYDKKIPKMLGRKIKFVRACTTSETALFEFRVSTEELLGRFEKMSSMRHDLIHGAITSISPIDNAFVFAKLDIRDGYHHHREIRFEATEYPRMVRSLLELDRMAHELAAAVFEVVKSNPPPIK